MYKSKNSLVLNAMTAVIVVLGLILAQPGYAASTPVNTEPVSTELVITEQQAKSVKIDVASLHSFSARNETVGYIDFNQDKLAQIFSPWQGRIAQVAAKAGDDVKKGQLLFVIDSPDLLQAESNLISADSTLQLTTQALARAKKMIDIQANTQRDIEQAVSDQHSAEGNYQAARNAVRIFGKSESEIDQIIQHRKPEGALSITSPFNGRVTSRSASVGLLTQPSSSPAPFTIADLSSMWMIATVAEYDLSRLQLGQAVKISLSAYPDRQYSGAITNIASAIDPATHRIAVRSTINNANHELIPQMLATFVITTGKPVSSVAIPANCIVREGDGSISVFVTSDGHHFERRQVHTGITQNGLVQVLDGVSAGEKVATDGALFLSNALALQSK
jgi:cobalt-zinc-cadmium efflux system membrane fusion protein